MTKQAEERVVLDVAVVEIVEEADVPDDPGDEDEDVEDEAGDHVVVSLLAAKKYLTETKKYFIPSMLSVFQVGQLELEMYPRLVLVPLIGESPLIRDVNSAPAKTGLSSNNFPASLLHINLFAIEIMS